MHPNAPPRLLKDPHATDRFRGRLAGVEDPTRAARSKLRGHERVVGRSRALAAVLDEVALAAPLEIGVLITGSTGTGKTDIARLLHDNSSRRDGPFVELNCNALPEALVESELFGADRGAHSTADRRVPGKVAAAEGGTLFLDEVADLPLGAQGKLLQLLQSNTYYALGAAHPSQARHRLVAATGADLEAAVEEGRFRSDLYYRLNVLPIRMPCLAERREDTYRLAVHFARLTCRRHRLPAVSLSPRLRAALDDADWPGNVRQLANAIEAAVVRTAARRESTVEPEALVRPGAPETKDPDDAELTFHDATKRFQARLLRTALYETGWNIVESARRLHLTRSHFYTLMKTHGIEREPA